jgi:hypothetical protein
MKIVGYRFRAFEAAFGRDPQPHEPLFFAADCSYPRKADDDQITRQLEQAANATGVSLPRLRRFLAL